MAESKYVIGAYTSLPEKRQDQTDYYQLLSQQDWIDGTEIPFPGDMADESDRAWFAEHLPKGWKDNTLTLIPGIMSTVGGDPAFGLAGGDDDGRRRCLAMARRACDSLDDLAQKRGSNDIRYVEVQSAPIRSGSKDAMAKSLDEMTSWDWAGAKLVIEHCDGSDGVSPLKGFLPLDDELDLCKEFGVGLTINWGRSAIEGHSRRTPLDHIGKAAQAGVLTGLVFSGAGPNATQYGGQWDDDHLPMNPDEPESWMGVDEIAACTNAAKKSPALAYIGSKIHMPDLSLSGRLELLKHIYNASL